MKYWRKYGIFPCLGKGMKCSALTSSILVSNSVCNFWTLELWNYTIKKFSFGRDFDYKIFMNSKTYGQMNYRRIEKCTSVKLHAIDCWA